MDFVPILILRSRAFLTFRATETIFVTDIIISYDEFQRFQPMNYLN